MFFIALCNVEGQEVDYGPGYQTIVRNNPAFTGTEGDGTLRLSYMNFYPGNNFNLNSFYVSYDSYMTGIHGGAGFYLADDYLGGIINDLQGGLSYAYHFQAGRKVYISAGLSASCYYRGFNTSNIILPDQIDPLTAVAYPSSESISTRGRAVFDIGAGIVVMNENLFAALSVIHLTAPDLSGRGFEEEHLNRKLTLNASGKVNLNESHNIIVRPVFLTELDSKSINSGIGSTIENDILSLSAVVLVNSARSVDLQAGCTVRSGRILLFYNYRFNISSGSRMIPASLMHQAGLAFSLNYVDKRKISYAINFPKL